MASLARGVEMGGEGGKCDVGVYGVNKIGLDTAAKGKPVVASNEKTVGVSPSCALTIR